MEQDLRYKILKHLNKQKNSTEEYHANEFLSTCHTDLGTIVRALLELVDEGLIYNCYDRGNSKYYQDLNAINTQEGTNGKNAKNALRFDDKDNTLGCLEPIKAVRIYITLKGLMFIQKEEKFKLDKINSKRTKNWYYLLLFLTISVAAGNLLDRFLPKEQRTNINCSQEMQSNKVCKTDSFQDLIINDSNIIDTTRE